MKKKVIFVIAAGIVITAAITVWTINTPEKRTLRYYNNHTADFDNDIETVKAGREPALRKSISVNCWNGKDDWSSKHAIIEYTVVSRGLVPSSEYYGFFYSFDDVPVAFENADVEMLPVSDAEWEWYGEGDNHGIVRRLDDNWFYFEAWL